MPELGGGRTFGDPTNLLEKIVRQREPLEGRPGLELSVKFVGHVARLNHLRHVVTISACCAAHVNERKGPRRNEAKSSMFERARLGQITPSSASVLISRE